MRLTTIAAATAAAPAAGGGDGERGGRVEGRVGAGDIDMVGLVRVASVCHVDVMMRGPESFGSVGDARDHLFIVVPHPFAHPTLEQAAVGVVEVAVEEEVEHRVHHGVDVP